MRRLALVSLLVRSAACSRDAVPKPAATPSYLYVWAGDSAKAESDFLAVINSDPTSPQYGAVVTTLPTGELGANPHHTEAAMPATFQYAANSSAAAPTHHHDGAKPGPSDSAPVAVHSTGGLVEMDERGTVVRARGASDPAIRDRYIYPYSVLALAPIDRAISTTTDMDEKNTTST